MEDREQELFELIHSIGEILEGDLHIEKTLDEIGNTWEDTHYRVYHKKGFCLDVCRFIDKSVPDDIVYEYTVYDKWDGFKTAQIEEYVNTIACWKQIQ